jgi:ribosome-associated protein
MDVCTGCALINAFMTEPEFEERKSKSQIKREMQALRDLGLRLVETPAAKLEKVPMSDLLRDAVNDAKGFRREALRRQLQHIGGLLRNEDNEAIGKALERLDQPHREEVRALHEIEQWRDELIAGSTERLTDLLNRYDGADRQHINQLIRNAQKEQKLSKPPKSARALFRYLSELRSQSG